MPDIERKQFFLESREWLTDNRIETANPQEEACLLLLYASNKYNVKLWQLKGCSYESAFWIDFVAMSIYSKEWTYKGVFDVRLSKLLEMYLKIFSENAHLKNEEQSAFFNLLKNRYYEVCRSFYHRDGASVRDLLKMIHREDDSIIISVLATTWVLNFINAIADDMDEMKWKLVEDI